MTPNCKPDFQEGNQTPRKAYCEYDKIPRGTGKKQTWFKECATAFPSNSYFYV